MKKNKKEELIKEADLLSIIAISIILVFIYIYPTITGFTVLTSSQYNFTFENPEDYVYNSSLILIENNSVKLKQIPYDFNSNLVSSYYFDEQSWNSDPIEDSTGNNDGIAYNGVNTISDGKINRAGNFDNIDDYIDLGNDSSLMPEQFSILTWIKINELPGKKEWDGIISKGDYDSGSGYEIYIRDSKTDIEPNKISFGLDTTRIYSDNIPNTNEWIHITATYDGTTMNLYINGNLEDSDTATLNTNNLPVYIGRRYSNEEYVFNGLIDEVSIYNKALTQEEIEIIYNQQASQSRSYTYYSENAFIETQNIDLPLTSQELSFSTTEELNRQIINYYYTNDESNWNQIENNSISNSTQIKIKAKFVSNTSSTPIIYNMLLNYQFCGENWDCNNWSDCYENFTQSRTCTDLNECNTLLNKPSEIQNCTYIPPCEENWTCSDWSSCINNNQTRNCTDLNFCNTTINQPIEIQNCTVEEITTTSSSSGEGSGGSSTFTRPTKIEEAISEEIPIEIETKQEQEEIITKTSPKTKDNNLQKFTGLVSYNIGKEGINITLLTVLISLFGLLYFRLKYKKEF